MPLTSLGTVVHSLCTGIHLTSYKVDFVPLVYLDLKKLVQQFGEQFLGNAVSGKTPA